jgi:hypothetical protein
MNKARKTSIPSAARTPAQPRRRPAPEDLQPQATGGNRGSPAAPVMKQFAKTKAESTGRS